MGNACIGVRIHSFIHVSYGKFAMLCMSMGVLPLCSSDLFLALLVSSPEFNLPLGFLYGIGHVQEKSIARYDLDCAVFAKV